MKTAVNVFTVKGSHANYSEHSHPEDNITESSKVLRPPSNSAAAAYTNVLVRMLLRKCNGDARKKLLESTLLNTLRSSHNLLNCKNLTTDLWQKLQRRNLTLTYPILFHITKTTQV